ncbi:hypothetical protein ACQ86D_01280 [Streptomyces galilaeus]
MATTRAAAVHGTRGRQDFRASFADYFRLRVSPADAFSDNEPSQAEEPDKGLVSLRAVVIFGIAIFIGLALGVGAGFAPAIPTATFVNVTAGVILGVVVSLGASTLWFLMAATKLNDLIRK